MLLSIQAARTSLSRLPLILGGNNTVALAVFLFVLFPGAVHVQANFTAVAFFAVTGFFVGSYLKYRSFLGSTCGLWAYLYLIFVMELMLSCAGSALVFASTSRVGWVWVAVGTNTLILLITLLAGMWREAKRLDFFSRQPDLWKKKLAKYLDFSRCQVSPLLSSDFPLMTKGQVVRSPIWIAAVGSANIPLFFEIFAEGRISAVLWVAPLLSGFFSYLNLIAVGPGLFRIVLLRRLEKCQGRRFVNTDLVQIQELRRGFWMARWFMKDFAGHRDGKR